MEFSLPIGGDFRKEGVANVRNDHPQDLTAAHGEIAGGEVGGAAQLFDSVENPVLGLKEDAVTMCFVEHEGDGGDGKAGARGNIPDIWYPVGRRRPRKRPHLAETTLLDRGMGWSFRSHSKLFDTPLRQLHLASVNNQLGVHRPNKRSTIGEFSSHPAPPLEGLRTPDQTG